MNVKKHDQFYEKVLRDSHLILRNFRNKASASLGPTVSNRYSHLKMGVTKKTKRGFLIKI